MKNGAIKDLFNSKLPEVGNDPVKAGKLTAEHLEKLLNDKKITPEDLKFDQLAHDLIPGYDDLRNETDPVVIQNAVTSSQFPTISKVAINSAILDSYALHTEGLDQLVSEVSATRTNEEYIAGFTDSEEPELRLESMSYEETNFGERDITVKMADFGRTLSITREAIFNDRTGQLLSNARSFGERGAQHRAKMIIQTLEVLPRTAFKEATGASKAFTYKGTAYQYTDFYNATNHTTIDGRTNVNLKTTNGLADYTDIQNAMDLFDVMKTPAGADMSVDPKFVVVHTKNLVKAWQILNSDTFMRVGNGTSISDFHNPNPYGPGGIRKFQVIGSRYIGTDTSWYIGDIPKQLKWLWVYRPATAALAASSDKVFFNNIIVTYKFSYHGGCGHSDYSYIVKNTA